MCGGKPGAPPLARHFAPGQPRPGRPCVPKCARGGSALLQSLNCLPSPCLIALAPPLGQFPRSLPPPGAERGGGRREHRGPRPQDSWTGHFPSTPLQTRVSGYSSETVELGVSVTILLIGHMGTPRTGVSPPCPHLRAESPLSFLPWPGLTLDLCGRRGPAGSLCPHLAWTCRLLS